MSAGTRTFHRVGGLALAGSLLLGSVAAVPSRAAGVSHYVSTTGSDAGSGTLDAPWRTLAKGLGELYPGDTLFVRDGTYRERIGCYMTGCVSFRPRAATATSRINVVAYPGERPVVQGLLWIRLAYYWTFNGINATWDSTTGTSEDPLVKIVGGKGWTFENAEVWGAPSYANLMVTVGNASDEPAGWRLAGNCIHDTYKAHTGFLDHNLYLHGSKGRGIIERNILYNALSGENIKIGAGSPSLPPPGYVTVRYNTLYNSAQNVLVAHGAHHIRVERNLIGRAAGKDWYPNVRGYYVSGRYNVALNNMGFSADRFLLNTDSTTGIRDGGGNRFPVNPNFDATTTCRGFHARSAAAYNYGRFAGSPLAGHWSGGGTGATPGWAAFGGWQLRSSNTSGLPDTAFAYGAPTDRYVVGDWDGDGIDTPGVYRNRAWYLRNSNSAGSYDIWLTFGSSTDKPVVGDWDGDGTDTIGFVRGNKWYLRNSNTTGPSDMSFAYGMTSDLPVVGDWDGDGVDTPGLYRAGTWYTRSSNASTSTGSSFTFGTSAGRPLVGDWDGDGVDSIGFARGSGWYLRNSNSTGASDIRFVYDLV